ncbi:MAG: hypothetical protein ACPG4Z_01070 [Chitinophagales bacterium]
MRRLFYYIVFTLFCSNVLGQTTSFTIKDYDFEIVIEIVNNEWESMDTVNKLYRIEDGSPVYLLKFYSYKDKGGDCNNVFWDKETLEINSDNLIFTTQYFQKTGMDPIPEYRKQIYQVNSDGKLLLIYDKYKFRYDDEWTESEYK